MSRPPRIAAAVAVLTCAAVAFGGVPAASGRSTLRTPVHDVSRTKLRAEGEEYIAVNPRNHGDLIVGSNQWQPLTNDNTQNVSAGPDGFTMCGVWSSHDGGATWTGGPMEETGLGPTQDPAAPVVRDVPSEFADPGNVISADQNTVFDRHGTAYYQCIDFGARTGDVVVPVYRSTDGGRHWSKPVTAFSERDTRIQIDRSWLAVDDSGGPRDGTLYLTWETMFYQGWQPQVYERSSTDGGRTWGPVHRVDDDANEAMWDPRQFPVVGADGTLYVMYDASPFHGVWPNEQFQYSQPAIVLATSRDGGRTFTRQVVQQVPNPPAPPDEAEPYFTEFIPAIAADPNRAGHLAIAWPQVDKQGETRILVRSSVDGGRTWTKPTDVNDDPRGTGNQHDHATLTYLPDGRLVVLWRDRRASGGAWTDRWQLFARAVSIGSDGSLRPGRVVVVTARPQTPTTNSRGNMPSEYIGATATAEGLYVSWDQLHGRLPDDMERFVPVGAFG